MTGEQIFSMIIIVLCCWGCGAIFLGIGIWAGRRAKPMHFWSGTEVDPKRISDIPAYNRENGSMWKIYSVPFWLAGLFSLFAGVAHWCSGAALALIALACIPGLGWLVWKYKQICKVYMR